LKDSGEEELEEGFSNVNLKMSKQEKAEGYASLENEVNGYIG